MMLNHPTKRVYNKAQKKMMAEKNRINKIKSQDIFYTLNNLN